MRNKFWTKQEHDVIEQLIAQYPDYTPLAEYKRIGLEIGRTAQAVRDRVYKFRHGWTPVVFEKKPQKLPQRRYKVWTTKELKQLSKDIANSSNCFYALARELAPKMGRTTISVYEKIKEIA